MSALRIGHLAVYFGLFDEAMPTGFRDTREAYRAALGEVLARHGDVVDPGLVDDVDSARAAGRFFDAGEVDVVVFAPTMAAPPGWAWSAIEDLAVPVIAVAGQESGSVPDDYDTETATARSLPVGLVMFTNVLVRRGRPFLTVVGELHTPRFDAAMADALGAVAAVSTVRRSPLLVVGEAIGGYDDVMATDAELAALGVRTDHVSAPALEEAFAAVDDGLVVHRSSEMRRSADATAVPDEVLDRSARLAVTLEDLVRDHGACGGAVNCHGPLFRRNPKIGITACLGVSGATSTGTPFSCTGDVPTSIALVVGKALAGSALYCELYQLDLDEDWILVANGGEGDMSIREPGTGVTLLPEEHYAGERGPGTAVVFEVARGPSTLVSLSPVADARGGWALVAAEGEILDSRHPTMEGPNGMFRFAGGPVATSFARWCEAGATHHAALVPGHRGDALGDVGRLLSIELRTV